VTSFDASIDISTAAQSNSLRRRPGRRPLACYHEAGHAAARWYFGYWTDRVVVLSTEQVAAETWHIDRRGRVAHGCEGIVEGHGIGPSAVMTPALVVAMQEDRLEPFRRDLHVSLEQDLVVTLGGMWAEARYRRVSVLTVMLQGGDGDMTHYRHQLNRWFPDPQRREATTQLAEQRASALIRSRPGWIAIEAIATGLLERGHLDGHEVDAKCAEAYGRERSRFSDWSANWPPTLEMMRNGSPPALHGCPS
jgi:hypothetical protein